MALQFFLPVTNRKAALKEVKRRITRDNKGKSFSNKIELKSLKKHPSTLKGGNPFYIGIVRAKKRRSK